MSRQALAMCSKGHAPATKSNRSSRPSWQWSGSAVGGEWRRIAFDCFANKAKAKQATKLPTIHPPTHKHTSTHIETITILFAFFFPPKWKKGKNVATFFEGGFSFCMLHDLELYSPVAPSWTMHVCVCIYVYISVWVCVFVCVCIFFTISLFANLCGVVFLWLSRSCCHSFFSSSFFLLLLLHFHSAHRFLVLMSSDFFM